MNIQEQNTSILNFEDDELIEEGIAVSFLLNKKSKGFVFVVKL